MKTCTIDYYRPFGTDTPHFRILYRNVQLYDGQQTDIETIKEKSLRIAKSLPDGFTHYKTWITKVKKL